MQYGVTPDIAKPLSGFGSGSVLELIEDYDRGTFRAVYTVSFPGAVYVPRVFRKKSRRGAKTPREDIELARTRLELARAHYDESRREEHQRPRK